MNPQISIIIVAYKVEEFISFCLKSILRSAEGFYVEIVIIDNEPSTELKLLIDTNFPDVIYHSNLENVGFGRACNQGRNISNGDALLFVNPDVIISKETISIFLNFSTKESSLGLATTRLLDGNGILLPETARCIPTFMTSFYKIIGLDKGYYEQIGDAEFQEIEVLCGALIFCQGEVFDQIGGFDERFFMYAEDIDLSKRSLSLDYKNYLLNNTEVVHLKGESTQKRTWNYNHHFYNSMYLYADKYIGSEFTKWQVLLVGVSTYILSFWNQIKRFFSSVQCFFFDLTLSFFFIFLSAFSYAIIRYGDAGYYDWDNVLVNAVLYSACWIGTAILSGAYYIIRKPSFWVKTGIVGVALSLILYALLPLDLRFSRAVVILSGVLTWGAFVLRSFWVKSNLINEKLLIIAEGVTDNEMEYLNKNIPSKNILNTITPAEYEEDNQYARSKEMALIWDINNNRDVGSLFNKHGAPIYLWDRELRLLLLSKSREIKSIRISQLSHHNLAQSAYMHQKRCADVLIGYLCLLPLVIAKVLSAKLHGWSSWSALITGKVSAVGYDISDNKHLVKLKHSVINVYAEEDHLITQQQKSEHYSIHYSILDDFIIVGSRFFEFLNALSR